MARRKMPPKKNISCPHCGHEQMEYDQATASTCHACGGYFRLVESTARIPHHLPMRGARREVVCHSCKSRQIAPADVAAWECTNCGSRLDFSNHIIEQPSTLSIHTYGEITITPKGHFRGNSIQSHILRLGGPCEGMIQIENRLIVDGAHAVLRRAAKTEHFEIEPSGKLEAPGAIECQTASFKGSFIGQQLTVAQELHVFSGAKIELTTLTAPSIIVEKGATFICKKAALGASKK